MSEGTLLGAAGLLTEEERLRSSCALRASWRS